MKHKNEKTSLKEKLKNSLKNLTSDPFNYEEMVTKNIDNYFKQVSKKHKVKVNYVNVRINLHQELNSNIFSESTFLDAVGSSELIDFFMGKGSSLLFGLEKKVESSVSQYLKDYAAKKEITLSSLVIVITKSGEKVKVMAFHNSKMIEIIAFKELLNYFTK